MRKYIWILFLLAVPFACAYQIDLMAYWNFNSGATDLTGHGNNGSIVGTPTLGAGKLGNGYTFDGSGEYLSVPDSSAFRLGTGNFTFSFWMKPTSFDGNNDASFIRVFEKTAYPNGAWFVLDLIDYDNDNLANLEFEMSAAVSANNTAHTRSTGTVGLNAWTHVAITVDRVNSNTKYYVNGVLDSTQGFSTNFAGVNLDIAGVAFQIGSVWNNFKGALDDMAIWKKALNSTEISYIYANGVQGYENAYPNIPEPSSFLLGLLVICFVSIRRLGKK